MATSSFLAWFWNERFWLPHNTTWADLRNTEDATYAQATDLWVMIPYSIVLYVIRFIIERLIARPLGRKLNISDVPNRPPSSNAVLDKVFISITRYPKDERLKGLCKQLDWSERQVQRWFRKKREIHRPSKLIKFSETVWRLLFYTGVLTFGIFAMHFTSPKCPWETRMCWVGYPDKQQLTLSSYWYYQTELAFYASCTISQFFDIKRKDFWVMCIHHFATILLICFSYSINMLNIGMLIMQLHDFSDVFLEASKIAKYLKHDVLATAGLVCFSLTFTLARIVYFPFWVLNSIYFDAWEVVGPFPSWYIFCVWLSLLQFLHIYWCSFIVKGVVNMVKQGGAATDERSESEATDSDEGNEENRKKSGQGDAPSNGVTLRKPVAK
ncbi:transcription factor protein [Ciona intestinalis]